MAPDLNIEKTNNFISKTNKKYKTELCLDDIYAYYDDTVFGSGDKGVCVTSSHIVVLVYDIGIVPIEQIEDIKISGALNKKITLILRDKQKLSFVLTQSNKGAETLVDIIQHPMIG